MGRCENGAKHICKVSKTKKNISQSYDIILLCCYPTIKQKHDRGCQGLSVVTLKFLNADNDHTEDAVVITLPRRFFFIKLTSKKVYKTQQVRQI